VTNDLDAYVTLPPPHGRVRILFEVISPSHPFIAGVFRTADDVEVDYAGLPLELRENILQSALDEVKKRRNET
jgi:hypothetical protein